MTFSELLNQLNAKCDALEQAELEMDAFIADAVASGMMMVSPNFDWRDLEVH
jgi:hypothetical protein